MQVYCDQRNRGTNPIARWSTREANDCFVISREGGFDKQGRALPDMTVLKICYQEHNWQLFVPHAQGGWVPYAPKPQVEHLEQIFEELDQAPLHIHW
ncbi:hypothetical protein MNBD_GAMMA13-521 [hydrothermal vent metagenome]|uniref:DUF3024 domain-containing protein n=1 Tax=hydrothermal vent metagenome TaxID=652676 RepID=A0A3B0YHW8_9ZZZZ